MPRRDRRRDYQRSRVYAWENRVVAPHDRSIIRFAQAQAMVDAIWRETGLRFPPKIEPLPAQTRSVIGRASRLVIGLGETTPSWCLLHELAHAMSMTAEGDGDGHGPDFIGLYVGLLARYLRMPADELFRSLAAAGIDAAPSAVAAFLD